MTKLEAAVFEFLEKRLLGESIDELAKTRDQELSSKADYFLFDRQVVVEVKDLVDNRKNRASGVLDKWRARPGWPVVYGSPLIQEVLKHHPQGGKVNSELFDSVTESLEGAFEKANRQIRETKRAFGLKEAHGLLFLVNQDVDIFEPRILATKVSRLFFKKDTTGQVRFPHVDSVLYITACHSAIGEDGVPRNVIIALTPPLAEGEDMEDSLEAYLMAQWAAFLNAPLVQGGVLRTPEDIDRLNWKWKRPPPEL